MTGWHCLIGWHRPAPAVEGQPPCCRGCGKAGALDAEGYLHVGTIPRWRRPLIVAAPQVEVLAVMSADGKVHWMTDQPEIPTREHAIRCVNVLLSAGLTMAKEHGLQIELPRWAKAVPMERPNGQPAPAEVATPR